MSASETIAGPAVANKRDSSVAGPDTVTRRSLTKGLLGAFGLVTLASCDQGDSGAESIGAALQGSASARWFDTYAELRAWTGGTLTTSSNVAIGRAADTGGIFVWSTDTTSADNKGTIIVPTAQPRRGCWKRTFDGVLNVKWFGATGTGSTDDSAAIRSALAALPSSGGVVFFPPGVYKVSRDGSNAWCLKITANNTSIVGGGHDVSTIKLANGQAAAAHVIFADTLAKISLQDISIDGNAAGQTSQQHGVSLAACSDVTISRAAIRSTSGSGVNIYNTGVRTTIADSLFSGSLLPSIAIQAFSDLIVSGCHFSSIASTNAHIKQAVTGEGQVATHATITGCTFLGTATSYGVWFRGISATTRATEISIVGNIFRGLYQAVNLGIFAQGHSISGNAIESCAIAVASEIHSTADDFTGNSNVSISGNVIRNVNAAVAGVAAIAVTNVTGCVISSNVVVGSTSTMGISVTHAQSFSICGNSVSIVNDTAAGSVGIQVVGSLDGVLASNVINMPATMDGAAIGLKDDTGFNTARVLVSDNLIVGAVTVAIRVEVSGLDRQLGIGENFAPNAVTFISGQSDATAAFPPKERFSFGGGKRTYGTSPPGSGTWSPGDEVINTAPAPGGYIGWVCVGSGSPGTWKGFGVVQT